MKKFIYFIIIPLLSIGALIGVMKLRTNNKSEVPMAQAKQVVNIPEKIHDPIVATSTKPAETRKEIIKYTVKAGDTISTIAEQFNISSATILLNNNLTATSLLQPGDVLSILPFNGIAYTIKSGDTIAKIALATGVAESDITKTNDLSTNPNLAIGKILLIPGATNKTPAAPTPKISAAKPTITKSATLKTTKKIVTTSKTGSVVWTSGALAELRKIPSFVRPTVKVKITNYAKSHGIKTITAAIYKSIKV
jgi:LysM repeat protein